MSYHSRSSLVLFGLVLSSLFVLLYLASQPSKSSSLMEPRLSSEQALEIAATDLRERYPNIIRITPYVDILYPEARTHPFPLIYEHPNGTQYYINSTNQTITSCHPSTAACIVYGEDIRNAISGRLVYLVDLVWFNKDSHSSSATYFIDAKSGDVVYRPTITMD